MSASRSTDVALGSALRRYWWVVLATVVLSGLAAFLVVPGGGATYTASGSYIVPAAGQSPTSQRSPYDAERLAGTYAVVLVEDQQLLLALSEQMGVDLPVLRDRMTAVTLPSSSAVRVTYGGPDDSEVLRFFDVLTQAVTEPTAVSPNIIEGTLRPLRLPTTTISEGATSGVVPVVAMVAGALIGAAAAVALERSNPRVDQARDLRRGRDEVILELGRRDLQAESELVAVRLLEGVPAAERVAVVASSGASSQLAEDTAEHLARAAQRLAALGRLPHAAAVEWPAGLLGHDGRAERAAQDADVTVVVVPAGATRRSVEEDMTTLSGLGVHDVVLLVVRSGRVSGLDRGDVELDSPSLAEDLTGASAARRA